MSDRIDFGTTRETDLDYLMQINTAVSDALFPNRTDQSMFLKMYEEVGEVVRKPGDGSEVADVLIMLLDHCSRHGIRPGYEILKKLRINLGRDWEVDPLTQVAYHIRENHVP